MSIPIVGIGGAVQKQTPNDQAGGTASFTTTGPPITVDHFLPVSGTGSSNYAWSGTSEFSLGAAAKLTYTGPNRPVLVTLNVTYLLSTILSASGIVISHNDDMVMEDQTFASVVRAGSMFLQADSAGANDSYNLSCTRYLVLANGDTIQPCFMCFIFDNTLSPLALTMAIRGL